jgi:hypothetical protein
MNLATVHWFGEGKRRGDMVAWFAMRRRWSKALCNDRQLMTMAASVARGRRKASWAYWARRLLGRLQLRKK